MQAATDLALSIDPEDPEALFARATLKELLDNDTSAVYAAQTMLEARARRA